MYAEVKVAHILFAATSVGLFAMRGMAMLWVRPGPKTHVWRILPHVVDTLLLACGVWLVLMLRLDPLRTPWLEVKLGCVVAYIVLGVLAFRLPGRWRPWAFAAALAMFGFIASIALTHDPRGIFSLPG